MLFVLNGAVLVIFGRRKIEAIIICDKPQPFLIDLNVLHHITVHFNVLDQVADPCNPQKLVVIDKNRA